MVFPNPNLPVELTLVFRTLIFYNHLILSLLLLRIILYLNCSYSYKFNASLHNAEFVILVKHCLYYFLESCLNFIS